MAVAGTLNQTRKIKRQNIKQNALQPTQAQIVRPVSSAALAGYVEVREVQSVDNENNVTYGESYLVRGGGGASYLDQPGQMVWIEPDNKSSDYIITGNVFESLLGAGINPATVNAMGTYTQQGDSSEKMPHFKSWAVGTPDKPSTDIAYNTFAYVDHKSELQIVTAARLDIITGNVPSAGQHRLALVYYNTFDDTVKVALSTAKAQTIPLDWTIDAVEIINNLPSIGTTITSSFWTLTGGATSISNADRFSDFRQWLNTPPVYGFPNPIPSGKNLIIHDGFQQIIFDSTWDGEITIEGEVTIV